MPAPHRPPQPPWSERGGYPDSSGDTAPIRHRPAPIQFRSEPPRQQSQNPALIWTLRGLGLLAVAVISGVAWWYINYSGRSGSGGSEATSQQRAGQYDFAPVPQVAEPRRDTNCVEHAHDQIKTFFQTTPCQQLTRGLYTTTTPDGRKVYTNVSVIRMADSGDAAKLRELADKDGTGNVNDLVREGVIKLPPLKSLESGGGYKSVQHDRNVIIVESDFDPGARKGDKNEDEAALDAICEDGIRLGDSIGGA